MRIQHNIMAMNAYRNYTNNVAAMKSNLEKLSSGYKINRAGDDAAGLAISEKMRAQITGLQTAQKNAKDGISLVQTAEGALTEVHDMLNRMVELASMSANGTYDNTTDRAQLQKEMNQLRDEINRIADSSNFNGIKLLNGDMSGDATVIAGSDRIINEVYAPTDGAQVDKTGQKTYLDGGVDSTANPTKFDVDFSGLSASFGSTAGTKAVYTQTVDIGDTSKWADDDTIKIGNTTYTIAATADPDNNKITKATVTTDWVAEKLEAAINESEYNAKVTVDGTKVTVTYTAKTPGDVGSADYDKAPKNAPTGVATAVSVNDADAKAAVVATDVKSAGADPAIKADFKVGGKTLATGIVLEYGDDNEAIAQKVLNKLSNANFDFANDADATEATATINDVNYKVTVANGKLTFELTDEPTADNINGDFDWDITASSGSVDGNHTAGTVVTQKGSVANTTTKANTVFRIEAGDIKDGTKIKIDDKEVTLAVGKNSKAEAGQGTLINLKDMEEGNIDLDTALSRISEGFKAGTTNFIVGVNNTANGDTHQGLTVHKNNDSVEQYDTKEKLANVFSLTKPATGGLRLQIGDTADSYNQLKVSIGDMHTNSLGISGISIADQDSAAAAVDAIKAAINKVSDVRGTLGATQNRLDHTINNLSVMTENIQDAESTIRDVDVAEEMMAYTKNNILIQSAQAMLAQANQVPQGVLQLLQ